MNRARTSASLYDLLTDENIRDLADGGSYQRGVGYYRQGRVIDMVEFRGRILATVKGTHAYRVELSVSDGQLDYECSCPVGDEGIFCKHCVAVALLAAEQIVPSAKSKKQGKKGVMEQLEEYLKGRKSEELVSIVMEQALRDEDLRSRLMRRVASAEAKETGGLKQWRRVIDQATSFNGFIDYYESRDYARGVKEIIRSLAELVDEGGAATAIELVEYAIKRVETALASSDDSNGEIGSLPGELQELHLRACESAPPDPEELAVKLFRWQIGGDFETFYGSYGKYSKVLGTMGRKRFRQLAEEEWKRVPALRPGDSDHHYRHRFAITSMMRELAEGNIEALVEVERRDLSVPYRFLEIAELYRKVGKSDEAIKWAREGIDLFPDNVDTRLTAFLIDEYIGRKQHKEAMELAWREFAASPSPVAYKTLKQRAGKKWKDWRPQALDEIRQLIASNAQGRSPYWMPRDNSILVEVLLADEDDDAAWQEAVDGGCIDSLWMELATRREKSHPEDALAIYRARIEPLIDSGAYQSAVGMLDRIQRAMSRLRLSESFEDYLRSIRDTHRRKRNLMMEVERMFGLGEEGEGAETEPKPPVRRGRPPKEPVLDQAELPRRRGRPRRTS